MINRLDYDKIKYYKVIFHNTLTVSFLSLLEEIIALNINN